MKHAKSIVWFRQDLRLADNPALYAASQQGSFLPVFILDQQGAGDFSLGASSSWWLHHSLQSLSDSLDGKLHLAVGDSESILKQLAKTLQVEAVYFNRCYEPWMIHKDEKIIKTLEKMGVAVHVSHGSLLWEPDAIHKSDGTPYKVYTAFLKNGCMAAQPPRQCFAKPKNMDIVSSKDSVKVDALKLLQKDAEIDRLDSYWLPGEANAHKRCKIFIEQRLAHYKIGRDFPAQEAVSRLSPHLRFGEISVHYLWWQVQEKGYDFATGDNVKHFLKELVWREFAYHVLYHNPTMPRENLHKKFDAMLWRDDKGFLQAWQMGQTGYPIVDAAMRELWNTGYMHNRMRMVVASFLVKNLMIHWHKGEDWFWNLLLDADLASNSFNWQWVAGCGYDAAPYFRIFNPVLQAKKFDPQAKYIRQWIPEISKLPDKYIFEPHKAPESILSNAGIVLGSTYPKPIVDIDVSRKQALDNFKKLK
ncbi:deoxyribodipyrimidine photo-lyase [Candidatus Babeliales bacterium]|nr:deoxyribodipyrimidine photo-lyase [Candidatus Babeliales bacterium]